ncbi:phage tail protein, partial [Escherichia coli]|nr:phage tail protein [Escherichia coli]
AVMFLHAGQEVELPELQGQTRREMIQLWG